MRFIAAALQSSLFTAALAFPSEASSFSPPFLNEAVAPYTGNDTVVATNSAASKSAEDAVELLKRQNCPVNYNSCSTLAAADSSSCCSVDSVCSLDNAGNVACCPVGSFCTGTIGSPPSPSSATVASATAIPTTTATGVVSYVPNPYFSFPYIPATFADSAACSSAYSNCASDYTQCTINLQGAATHYAVTIIAPGGGITVSGPAVTGVAFASAVAICSSLSSLACPGTAATCSAYAQSTGTGGLISAGAPAAEGKCWVVLLASVMAGIVGWLF